MKRTAQFIVVLFLLGVVRFAAAEPNHSVVGHLMITSIDSKILGQPRTLRIWLPPNYDADPQARFDVLYLHDGQNCFDTATSAFGKEWRIDETLTQMIAAGGIRPIVVIAIDNDGEQRLDEMTFDTDPKHGGGGAAKYADFILNEVMPWATSHYRLATGPDHTTLGGSSLGGLVSLEIVRRHPGVFGGIIAMSPSVWWNNESLLHAIKQSPGGLDAARIFLSVGERENFKSADDPENKQIVQQVRALAAALGVGPATMPSDDLRTHCVLAVVPNGVHDENTWAELFPAAVHKVIEPNQP